MFLIAAVCSAKDSSLQYLQRVMWERVMKKRCRGGEGQLCGAVQSPSGRFPYWTRGHSQLPPAPLPLGHLPLKEENHSRDDWVVPAPCSPVQARS